MYGFISCDVFDISTANVNRERRRSLTGKSSSLLPHSSWHRRIDHDWEVDKTSLVFKVIFSELVFLVQIRIFVVSID